MSLPPTGVAHLALARSFPRLAGVRLLALTYGPAALIVVLVAGAAVLDAHHSSGFLTKEPAEAVRAEGCHAYDCSYAGVLSNLGLIAWAAGAAAAAFAALLLGRGRDRRLLVAGAALSGIFLLDDGFMLHEHVWAYAFGSEDGMFVVLAVLALAFGIAFRDRIATMRTALLGSAVGWLVASLAMDVLLPYGSYVVEDGAKFLGICGWTVWLVIAARHALRTAAAAAEA